MRITDSNRPNKLIRIAGDIDGVKLVSFESMMERRMV